MNALMAFIVALQSTFGPSCFLHDQGVLPDACLETMGVTVFVPTVVAAELLPPLGDAVELVAAVNREILPTKLVASPLPDAYYLKDDIQYFPAGHEFKLQREAAALRAATTPERPTEPFGH